MPTSVHDNWVYAQVVDHERCRIVFHTVYPHVQPPEFTDIIFEGAVVHHFEQQKVGSGPNPANVLFDVEATEGRDVLAEYGDLLARTRNHGWPVPNYEGVDDLAAQLTTAGAACFRVSGVCGLNGFVFAASMELRTRPSRAEVVI
jgi:hypothetical protein